MQQTIRAAIIGYGNIGKAAVEALARSEDFTLAGIVRRNPSAAQPQELADIPVVAALKDLEAVDVALLCAPTRSIPDLASDVLAQGVRTVDSFDIHGEIPALHRRLNAVAKDNGTVSVISAGWDPGSDSVIRALLLALAPHGITYTNFGPGMSMGHSTAVKNMDGVRDALALTMPLGAGVHRRMVYIELAEGYQAEDVIARIKRDPYFVHDDTHVSVVSSIAPLKNTAHGVLIERSGASGNAHNQRFGFTMTITNPALTAQVMVACARASMRLSPGCYTMIEVPPVMLLPGDPMMHIAQLV
jgi:diaminopimelate dehydrogenase